MFTHLGGGGAHLLTNTARDIDKGQTCYIVGYLWITLKSITVANVHSNIKYCIFA